MPGISDQSVRERLEITYRCKAIFAFLSSDDKEMSVLWNQKHNGKDFYLEYRAGMSMTIGGRKFASYNRTTELCNLLFMLLGKQDTICSFYYSHGDMGVYVGFPDDELYRVESIYDCAESQLVYDSVNYLITREGHVGLHINTETAITLKQEVELSIQRRMNANDLLAGL